MTRRMNIAIYLDEKVSICGGVTLVGSALCKLLHSYGHEVTLLNSNQFANRYSSIGLKDEHPDLLPGLKHHLHEDLMSSADAILFLSTRHQVPDFLQRFAGGNQSSVRWTVQGVNCIIIGQSSLNLRVAKMIWGMIGQLDVCGMPYTYRPLYQELRDVEESATPSI